MENNIFDINMKEPVHDAIISWIIRGINSKNKTTEFYGFSVNFLKMMKIEVDENTKVKVEQQYTIDLGKKAESKRRSNGFIDIFATFTNDDSNERYLVIEDKVYTEENKQYEEYQNGIFKDKNIKTINEFKNVSFIYIKLGKITPTSKYKADKFNWKVITIEDIIEILPKRFEKNSYENAILEYYREFLLDLERNYNSYNKLEVSKWTEHSIFGFFDSLLSMYPDYDFMFKSGYCAFWSKKVPIEITDKNYFNLFFELELYAPNKKGSRFSEWKYVIKLEDIRNNQNDDIRESVLIKLREINEKVFNDKLYINTNSFKSRDAIVCWRGINAQEKDEFNKDEFHKEVKEQIEFFENYKQKVIPIIKELIK